MIIRSFIVSLIFFCFQTLGHTKEKKALGTSGTSNEEKSLKEKVSRPNVLNNKKIFGNDDLSYLEKKLEFKKKQCH